MLQATILERAKLPVPSAWDSIYRRSQKASQVVQDVLREIRAQEVIEKERKQAKEDKTPDEERVDRENQRRLEALRKANALIELVESGKLPDWLQADFDATISSNRKG